MMAKAFCPGHVTGFFEIFCSDDSLSTGSRGAGMCLSLGATSLVHLVESGRKSIEITINGMRIEADVSRAAAEHLVGERAVEVTIDTTLDLPVSQGFGMSAAGSLSASIALAGLLGLDIQRAFEAAHRAEVLHKCGFGDVPAIHRGGVTVRKRPGLPPHGEVLRIDGAPDIVLCVVGEERLTKEVLSDPGKLQRINEHGGRCVDALLRNPSVENLMRLSSSFAFDSGLATKQVLLAIEAASKVGMASMAMLGNAVFAVGDVKVLKDVLSDFGNVFTCAVDLEGPRMV